MEKSKKKIRKELANHYSGEKAEEYNYTRTKKIWDREILGREIEIVHQFLKNSKPGKLLDVACGTGRIIPFYDGRKVWGVDISKDMLKIAKKTNPRAHLKVCDANKLPFKDNTFSVVITSRFICHLPDYNKSIKEMVRVASPGGSVIIDFPNKHSFSYFTVKYRLFSGNLRYFNLFSFSDIKKISKEYNLEIAEIEYKAAISGKLFPKVFHNLIKKTNRKLIEFFPIISYPYYVRFVKR